jgi:hypothetical protein
MGFSESREHRDGNVRFTVNARSLDFLAYKEWLAETIKERRTTKQFLLWTYESWDREETPVPMSVTFQVDPDPTQPGPPTTTFGPFASPEDGPIGFREVKQAQLFVGSEPESPFVVSRINAMKVEFAFDREPQEITIGKNWLTLAATIIVILIILAAGGWVLAL